MARRKLRSVPDLPSSPPDPKPPKPERIRYISRCSRTVFRVASEGTRDWLTIGQLQKAFQGDRRVILLGLQLTSTDLDVLRFVYTSGAPEGGRHRWRAYGTPTTLVRSLFVWLGLDAAHARRSLRRLQQEELLDVHGQEVWTTHQLHSIGAELLWCDLLKSACPDRFDWRKLDWYTVTKDVDRLFTVRKLDPKKIADRRTVMHEIVSEVQRRCKTDD